MTYFNYQDIGLEKLKPRHWSYIGHFEDKNGRRYFLKIPKSKRYISNIGDDIKKKQNIDCANQEYHDLIYLQDCFKAAPVNLKVVNAVDYISEYNAVVTIKSSGDDLYKLVQNSNYHGTDSAIRDTAQWIAHFHNNNHIENDELSFNRIHASLDTYINFISHKKRYSLLTKIINESIYPLLRDENVKLAKSMTKVIDGYEIRNFLYEPNDRHGGSISFLDPQKIQSGFLYEDIARYIVSLEMIYWGTYRVLIGNRVHGNLITHYIDEYRQHTQYKIENRYLWCFTIYMLLFRWHEAENSLMERPGINTLLKKLLSTLYIDRFFYSKIKYYAELLKL